MTSLGHVAPPTIPGFTHLRLLGAGGYSKVHLYEQHMPHREVAVKVVNVDVDGSQVFRFESEANLMAKVSTHPAIVSVYGAGVSEDGHPYQDLGGGHLCTLGGHESADDLCQGANAGPRAVLEDLASPLAQEPGGDLGDLLVR